MNKREAEGEYDRPRIVYEGELEVRAGSPLGAPGMDDPQDPLWDGMMDQ